MTLARAQVVPVLALSLACVRTDASAPATPEPAVSQPAVSQPVVLQPAPVEAAPVAKVCERVWALVSAESVLTEEAVADFERYMDACVAMGEEERRTLGEDEYQRRAACVLAAADTAELRACEPSPPPTAREPARFPEGAVVRDLSEVMEHAVYSPNPDQKELQQTKAARFDKADGAAMVAFCVDTQGVTSDIHTVQKFPGDPQVDKVLRDTIARWRFKPFIVDGAIAKVCTERRFVLRFK
jgi:hypothetical protein